MIIKNLVQTNNLSNVELIGKVPIEAIPDFIAESSVCLGIFGDTEKTLRVIPNKVYEYVAMAKPVITANSPAIKEVFEDNKDMIFCKAADGRELAEKIEYLYAHPEICKSLGEAAYAKFISKLDAKVLGEQLVSQLYETDSHITH